MVHIDSSSLYLRYNDMFARDILHDFVDYRTPISFHSFVIIS